jgi:WD40 repeat protein
MAAPRYNGGGGIPPPRRTTISTTSTPLMPSGRGRGPTIATASPSTTRSRIGSASSSSTSSSIRTTPTTRTTTIANRPEWNDGTSNTTTATTTTTTTTTNERKTAVAANPSPAVTSKMLTTVTLAGQWHEGPMATRLLQSHDRPVYCVAIHHDSGAIVNGSADHTLHVFDGKTGRYQRELYGKNYGHTEWVTSCAYLSDGRIISGGMDSRVCIWNKTGVRSDALTGHSYDLLPRVTTRLFH